jgi:hypothetical protein
MRTPNPRSAPAIRILTDSTERIGACEDFPEDRYDFFGMKRVYEKDGRSKVALREYPSQSYTQTFYTFHGFSTKKVLHRVKGGDLLVNILRTKHLLFLGMEAFYF